MQKRAIALERSVILSVVLVSACSSCGPQKAAPPPPIPTPTGSVTDIEGNVYPTIKIGGLEWMVENLKTATYNDGTAIPNVTDKTAWANLSSDAYSWYDNDVTNKDVYGGLYNFYAVNTKKLCPTGWDMPSSASYNGLVNTLGGKAVAGGRMKEVGTTLWQSPNAGATDESGFSARPAGERYFTGSFAYKGQFAYWWCSDEKLLSLPAESWFWSATSTNPSSAGATSVYQAGYSVRCIRSAN
jgi:uncharacterized protein (TIGR02145 family)